MPVAWLFSKLLMQVTGSPNLKDRQSKETFLFRTVYFHKYCLQRCFAGVFGAMCFRR